MTNNEKPVNTPDKRDHQTDSITPRVADALAQLKFPPLDEIDTKTAVDALTDDDRKALAALGSPMEMVSRIVAEVNAKSHGTPQSGRSTQMRSSAATSTQITARPDLPTNVQEFGEVLQRLAACDKDDRLSWNYDYRKKKIIGRGGQGTVYLTECLNEHNLPKALKVFSPRPYGDVESYYQDMDRMGRVASLVYCMQVDNLVLVERFAYHHGICVMIMRWIDGHDLATLLEPRLLERLRGCVDEDRWKELNDVVVTNRGTIQSRLKPGMAVNIIEKCLRALDALHSQGIVHGDIKPSNIMLDRYGSIRMVDIGSAFDLSAPPPCRRTWTPRYAPPEILERREWTTQSDLASLGYVLIELLGGQPAVVGADIGSDSTRVLGTDWERQLLKQKLQLPDRLGELLPADVQESEHLMNILRRLIDPDPRRRFANAEDALIGPSGTYQFLQRLAQLQLSAPFSQEIKRWLADVKTVLP